MVSSETLTTRCFSYTCYLRSNTDALRVVLFSTTSAEKCNTSSCPVTLQHSRDQSLFVCSVNR